MDLIHEDSLANRALLAQGDLLQQALKRLCPLDLGVAPQQFVSAVLAIEGAPKTLERADVRGVVARGAFKRPDNIGVFTPCRGAANNSILAGVVQNRNVNAVDSSNLEDRLHPRDDLSRDLLLGALDLREGGQRIHYENSYI